MIEALRSVWTLYRMSLQIDRKKTIWWTFLAAVQPLGIFIFALGLRQLVNGALAHDTRATMIGAIALAILVAGMVLHMVRFQADGVTLADKHSMVIDRCIIELKSSIPDLLTQEDAKFQSELHALQSARFWMTWETEATVGVVMGFLQLVGIGILMFSVQPLILLLPAFVLPSLWVASRGATEEEKARQASSEDTRLARIFVRLTTTAAAGKEIRLFAMADDMIRRHAQASERANRILERVEHQNAALAAGAWAVFAVAYAVAIVLAINSSIAGATRAGDVLMMVVLGTQASAVAARGVFMGRTFARVVSGGSRFRALERQARAATRQGAGKPPEAIQQGLTLRDVSFRYPGSDAYALKDVTLHVPRGAVVALIGENGAGKTTLVKLISGLYTPTRGTISLDSTDLATVDQHAWRRMIGAGFQDFCRFEFLIRESIGVGDVTLINDKSAVARGLEVAGGLRLPEALPSGLETQLGTTWPGGIDLSGGQWQTIALARASMHPGPLLVILDEPTSALDAHAEHQLFERISVATRRDNTNGRITLLVSHRFSTARMADLIVVLEKGEITEIGSHEQLMQNAGLYSELFETQAAAYR